MRWLGAVGCSSGWWWWFCWWPAWLGLGGREEGRANARGGCALRAPRLLGEGCSAKQPDSRPCHVLFKSIRPQGNPAAAQAPHLLPLLAAPLTPQVEYGAHAVLHCGMHGTVEWLPGASLGNSGFSWSDVLLGAKCCWVVGGGAGCGAGERGRGWGWLGAGLLGPRRGRGGATGWEPGLGQYVCPASPSPSPRLSALWQSVQGQAPICTPFSSPGGLLNCLKVYVHAYNNPNVH